MNCDTAFELMTDPRSRQSGVLLAHLDACPRCRQMQETLEPALSALSEEGPESLLAPSLFQSVPSAETVPFVTPEAVAVAEQAARTLALTRPTATKSSWQRRASTFAGYAAAMILGGLTFATFWPSRNASDSGSSVPAAIDGACTRNEVTKWKTDRPDQTARTVVLSCLACHHGNKDSARRDETRRLFDSLGLGWLLRESRDPVMDQLDRLLVDDRGRDVRHPAEAELRHAVVDHRPIRVAGDEDFGILQAELPLAETGADDAQFVQGHGRQQLELGVAAAPLHVAVRAV